MTQNMATYLDLICKRDNTYKVHHLLVPLMLIMIYVVISWCVHLGGNHIDDTSIDNNHVIISQIDTTCLYDNYMVLPDVNSARNMAMFCIVWVLAYNMYPRDFSRYPHTYNVQFQYQHSLGAHYRGHVKLNHCFTLSNIPYVNEYFHTNRGTMHRRHLSGSCHFNVEYARQSHYCSQFCICHPAAGTATKYEVCFYEYLCVVYTSTICLYKHEVDKFTREFHSNENKVGMQVRQFFAISSSTSNVVFDASSHCYFSNQVQYKQFWENCMYFEFTHCYICHNLPITCMAIFCRAIVCCMMHQLYHRVVLPARYDTMFLIDIQRCVQT